MANSASGTKSGQSPPRPAAKERRTSATALSMRSTLLVVLWRCGEPKTSDAPRASRRPAQKALAKGVSRSETSTRPAAPRRGTQVTRAPRRSFGSGGLERGDQPDEHLQKVVAGERYRKFDEVEANVAAAARRHRKRVERAGGRQMVGVDALADRAGSDVLLDCGRQARPPYRAARQR